MSNTSNVSGLEGVPDVIRRYFVLDADREVDSIVALFSDDATVVDEGETRHGTTAIRAWASVAIRVHDGCPRHRRTYRRPVRGHGPADGQLPRRHRRFEVGLHDRERTHQATRHRTMNATNRSERIISRVRAIPPGFVSTYKDIEPDSPRLVVRSDGSAPIGARQLELLRQEGVPVRGYRVDLDRARLLPDRQPPNDARQAEPAPPSTHASSSRPPGTSLARNPGPRAPELPL